ncbi:MAG: hypothetical protein HQL32_09900 [Planctomycetes bacterium]|nr:hypothetical protein [Planctomycetota bacterium]
MKAKAGWIIISILAFAMIGGAVYVYNNESYWREEVREVGLTGEAKRNQFLALTRFYQELGYESIAINQWQDLDFHLPYWQEESAYYIILPITYLPKNKERCHELIDWVEGGGHLITGCISSFNEEQIEAELKNFLEISHAEESIEEKSETITWKEEHISFDISITPPMQVNLRHPQNPIYTSDNNIAYAKLSKGEGSIQFIADLNIFSNDSFGDQGCPTLAYSLIKDNMEFTKVSIVHKYQDENILYNSLFSAWRVFALLFLLVAITFLTFSGRFGPVLLSPAITQGMNYSHYLLARGRYAYRHNNCSTMKKRIQQSPLLDEKTRDLTQINLIIQKQQNQSYFSFSRHKKS